MRSSKLPRNLALAALTVSVCLGLSACDPPAETQQAQPVASVQCVVDEALHTAPRAQEFADLLDKVEESPLFLAALQEQGVQSCRASVEANAILLEYGFKRGGSLQVQRDASIEYTDQVARFSLADAKHAETLLAEHERHFYGAAGCGIDYGNPETESSSDQSGETETVFRGDVCNCQARVRKDINGKVVGLVLRSAC